MENSLVEQPDPVMLEEVERLLRLLRKARGLTLDQIERAPIRIPPPPTRDLMEASMALGSCDHTAHQAHHHHVWDRDIDPVLEADDGATIEFETMDASGG